MIAWRLGGGWMFGSGCGRGVLSEGFGEGVVEGLNLLHSHPGAFAFIISNLYSPSSSVVLNVT